MRSRKIETDMSSQLAVKSVTQSGPRIINPNLNAFGAKLGEKNMEIASALSR